MTLPAGFTVTRALTAAQSFDPVFCSRSRLQFV
jgi:hypothetical protein